MQKHNVVEAPTEDAFARFNIFRALSVERREKILSNFLVWLLNPSETHGQGDLFLRAFVDAVDQNLPRNERIVRRRSKTTKLFQGAQVYREFNRVDVLIVLPRGVIVAIENKVGAKESLRQLSEYAYLTRLNFPNCRHVFVYLTVNGGTPSDPCWCACSHHQVMRAIAVALDNVVDNTPKEIRTFIKHYVNWVEELYIQR